ncbi:MAG TPA: hypothetical protein DEG47_01480 [Cyanobacteria bacterium UBA11148]|nr:hypothetical protein [Cyanobacteria bacterium UBA11148]
MQDGRRKVTTSERKGGQGGQGGQGRQGRQGRQGGQGGQGRQGRQGRDFSWWVISAMLHSRGCNKLSRL